jgi:hypothetical protein
MTQPAQQIETGLSNSVYNLVLLLQQAASDVVRYEAFAEDAVEESDSELAEWLRELAASDREIVDRAQRMLRSRLQTNTERPGGAAPSDEGKR